MNRNKFIFLVLSCIYCIDILKAKTQYPETITSTLWTLKTGKASFCCEFCCFDKNVAYFFYSEKNLYVYRKKNTLRSVFLPEFKSKNPGFKRLLNSTTEDCFEIDVSKSVAKEYECHYKDHSGDGTLVKRRIFHIKIYEIPNIFDAVKKKDVVLGSDETIPCKASGTPNLTITWFNSLNKVIQSDSEGTLNLKNIGLSDEGTYTCVATIKYPEEFRDALKILQSTDLAHKNMKKIFTLTVLFAPILDIKMYETYTDIGHTEVIKIRVKGRPIPKLGNCNFLQLPEKRKISVEKLNEREVEFTVTFEKIEREEAGEYSCIASNSQGKTELKIKLILTPSPAVITSPNSTDHSDYYRLQWSVVSKAKMRNVTVEIQSERNGKSFTDSRNFNLSKSFQGTKPREQIFSHHLPELKDDASHTIVLNSCNDHGCTLSKNAAVFKTPVGYEGNKVSQETLNNPATPDPKGDKMTQRICADCSASGLIINSALILAALIHRLLI